MKKTLLFVFALSLIAALPSGVEHWTNQQLNQRTEGLAGKVKDHIANETLGKWGNHSVLLVHRDATGQSELHETQADIIIVRNGSGSIVLGGEVEGGKSTAPNEIRGAGIRNGETQALHQGDVVHVPPKTAHQVKLNSGQTIDYLAIKVDAQ